jgi:hypothetical protein
LTKSFQLGSKPWLIVVNDTTLCVQLEDPTELHFYDLHTFSLSYKYDHGWCGISEIDSIFYEFNCKSSKIYCYSSTGVLAGEFNTNLKIESDYEFPWDGYIFEFSQNLFIILDNKKYLLKF